MRNHTHQAGLRPPSTSKSPLQLNQSSPAFTFAVAIDCNLIRRQTGAAVLAALDITFAAKHSLYTGERMARRKRAGLFPAYAHSPQADGPGSTRRYVRRLLAGLFCSCGVDGDTLKNTPVLLGSSPGKSSMVRVKAGGSWFNSGHEQIFRDAIRRASSASARRQSRAKRCGPETYRADRFGEVGAFLNLLRGCVKGVCVEKGTSRRKVKWVKIPTLHQSSPVPSSGQPPASRLYRLATFHAAAGCFVKVFA